MAPRSLKLQKDRRRTDFGLITIGFICADTRAEYLALKEKGVRFFSEPYEFRSKCGSFISAGLTERSARGARLNKISKETRLES